MAYKPVSGQFLHELVCSGFHPVRGNVRKDLTLVLIHFLGADIEPAFGIADGCIGEKREFCCARIGLIGSYACNRMSRADKSRHGKFFHDLNASVFRIVAHGMSAREHEKFTFFRKLYEFVGAGESEFPATPGHEQQVGMIKYLTVFIREKQSGLWFLF